MNKPSRAYFHKQFERLAKANLLYLVTEKFGHLDLHPEAVDNARMGLVFEELISKFAENSNETAGEHLTPREVIRLMMNLLFIEDDDVLTPDTAVVRTIYDPTAGTGGMLSIAGEHLLEYNAQARLTMYGQELNEASYAICKADMLIKGNVALQSRPARCGRIFSCAQGHGRALAPRLQLARQPHARARERIRCPRHMRARCALAAPPPAPSCAAASAPATVHARGRSAPTPPSVIPLIARLVVVPAE